MRRCKPVLCCLRPIQNIAMMQMRVFFRVQHACAAQEQHRHAIGEILPHNGSMTSPAAGANVRGGCRRHSAQPRRALQRWPSGACAVADLTRQLLLDN